jgi:hypothetical protein
VRSNGEVRSVLVVAIEFIAVAGWATGAEPETWRLYQSAEADIRLIYPESWSIVVAATRADSLAAWSATVLERTELHKITFVESGEVPWPGEYQIRVLANPGGLNLDAFYAGFDLSDLWDESESDTTIGSQPAKTWVRWAYDSLKREYLLVNSVGIVHVLYDAHNSNDPDFAEHESVYTEMTSSLQPVKAPSRLGQEEAVPPD